MRESAESTDPRRKSLHLLVSGVTALVMLVAVAACGGSEEDGSTADADADQTEGSVSEAAQPEADDEAASDNYARVTIGSETFEIPPDGLNLCNSLDNLIFGSFAMAADGSATQAGGTDAATQINFGVPVPNWEEEGLQAPLVNLDLLDEGVRWFASVDRGLGSVDSWELADGMASGVATFEAEDAGSGNVVGTETGSFEIVCR